MRKEYILVSQGIEIYRAKDLGEAIKIKTDSNHRWYAYCIECSENNERPADNEVFMYEE
jgi:tRNA U38,U39,U40 pseudouridine synthase TruA